MWVLQIIYSPWCAYHVYICICNLCVLQVLVSIHKCNANACACISHTHTRHTWYARACICGLYIVHASCLHMHLQVFSSIKDNVWSSQNQWPLISMENQWSLQITASVHCTWMVRLTWGPCTVTGMCRLTRRSLVSTWDCVSITIIIIIPNSSNNCWWCNNWWEESWW